MIGFRPNGMKREVEDNRPALRDEHTYHAIRRGRFFRLWIASDDWVVAFMVLMVGLGGMIGYALGVSP